MAKRSLAIVALAVVSFVGYASPVVAGPIHVVTQIAQAGSPYSGSGILHSQDEIPVPGLGNWVLLTTGGGVNHVVSVPADQASVRQPVVGFWPVMEFRDRAHYEAEVGTVATVPDTPVSIYVEVYNGEWASGTEYQGVFFDAVVSARVSAEVGQNAVDWRFVENTKQVQFGDTQVSIGFEPVRMPDSVPRIQFADFSPPIGFPGPVYYPTLLEATIDVSRPEVDPGSDGSGEPEGEGPTEAPEPASALRLLTGFALVGLTARCTAGRRSGL